MYRRASRADIDEIVKIPSLNMTREEVEGYLNHSSRYLYVYENEKSSIVGASIFGPDTVDDDEYDSEIFGIFTKNVKAKDIISSEILFQTKKALFEKGFRNLIVWCDEKDQKQRKFLKSLGGLECRQRSRNNKVEVAYAYKLFEYQDDEDGPIDK